MLRKITSVVTLAASVFATAAYGHAKGEAHHFSESSQYQNAMHCTETRTKAKLGGDREVEVSEVSVPCHNHLKHAFISTEPNTRETAKSRQM